MRLTLIVMY